MEKRSLVNNEKISLLGFGCMRFPTKKGVIDRPRALDMIDYAYQNGINYFDTAYPYHKGESELFMGEALKRYPRESFYLATKLPTFKLNTIEDVEKVFFEQLEKLQVEYFDFYLLHTLNKSLWDKMLSIGAVDKLIEYQKQGKIKYLGFSFHDDYPVFEEIITYRKWDFCQIQLNYMDMDIQAGLKGLLKAQELGVPVAIMEPIKGGLLAKLPDEYVSEFRKITKRDSMAKVALRYVASLPNVYTVLSGMSLPRQVVGNINTFKNFRPLTKEEMAQIDNIADKLKHNVNNGCTGCRYCMPCPKGVDIPLMFRVWNEHGIYKYDARFESIIKNADQSKHASNCIKCGLCETKCPQKIAIKDDLVKVNDLYENLKK